MLAVSRHRRDWEELGTLDPLWAVATDPSRKFGRWASASDEFFDTGAEVVSTVLAHARTLGRPWRFERALDFGCGVGRLTRALAARFDQCAGVDVAHSMVETARRLNSDVANCHFSVNATADLGQFEDDSFDFVLSVIVLQHLPTVELMRGYIGEFLRVVRPGGVVAFQVPARVPPLARAQVPLRLYRLLRGVGLSEAVVYSRLGVAPMRMNAISDRQISALLDRHSGVLLDAQPDNHAPAGFLSRTLYVACESRDE